MESDPDEQTHPGAEDLTWSDETAKSVRGVKPGAKYTKLTEHARSLISAEKQCSMFCGGKKCKYCRPDHWKDDQMGVKGIYSHWVTENILAMARPTTAVMKKFRIIEQFKRLGIMSIVNLQTPGEHSACGYGLGPSGFSYDPQKFMKEEIFFYNFGWPDYGVASLVTILDMVKVMQFAVAQGKVAVHCHAGLGRTGVIIACYLVYTNRMSAEQAVHYTRSQRPGSIQTRGQIRCVREFELYLHPFWIVFATRLVLNEQKNRAVDSHEFSLQQYLNRQRHLLHGYEGRKLKHLPKIIYVLCERLKELALSTGTTSEIQNEVHMALIQDELPRAFGNCPKPIPMSDSRDSIFSVTQKESKHVLSRKQSVSLETLNDEIFKNVLAENDGTSLGKLSSNSSICSDNTSSDTPPTLKNMNARVEEDDDSCIVFGNNNKSGVTISEEINEEASLCESQCPITQQESENNLGELNKSSLIMEGNSEQDLVGRVAEALTLADYDDETKQKAEKYELSLNVSHTAWVNLTKESNPFVLSAILWDWLDQLKEPVLRVQDLTIIFNDVDDPQTVLMRLEKGTKHIIEYCTGVLSKLRPIDKEQETRILARLLSHFTQQRISYHSSESMRQSSLEEEREDWGEMKSKEAVMLLKFFNNLIASLNEK